MVRASETETNQNKPLPPQEESAGEMVRTERSNSTGNKIRVTVDSDGLDCTICTEPLCPPVHECCSGHLLCISCWKNVEYICPTCRQTRGKRNIAFEAVLESAHVPCTYANLGCRESVSYSKSLVHADTCEFGPSLCPIPGCGHKAFSGKWREHFLKEHWNPGPHNSEVGSCFNYDEQCAIRFDENDLYYTLLGPGKDLFLLVKEPILNVGYVPLLYYIDVPDRGQNVFPCELRVVTRENCHTNSVTRQSNAVSIKEWNRGEVRDFSLFLPVGYDSRNTEIHILIKEEGEEKKEEEDKEEEEDKDPPAKRNKRLAAEASIKTKVKLEKKEKDGGKEVKVQEEEEEGKKGKKREAAAKPQKKEKKEAKASTSNAAKEKNKPAAKKQGKEIVSEEVKSPTKVELHAVLSELLMKVDFNTITIGDILQQLGAQFKIDLMDRKKEVKQIIEDVLKSMSEEEEDEDVLSPRNNDISYLKSMVSRLPNDGAESENDMEIIDVDPDDSNVVACDDFFDNFIKDLGFDLPRAICTCTGIARKCYKWNKWGWQSSCCTGDISKYPLPKRPGLYNNYGRCMSKGVFQSILIKLDGEGYNFAEAIDLKEFWGKPGIRIGVTKRKQQACD